MARESPIPSQAPKEMLIVCDDVFVVERVAAALVRLAGELDRIEDGVDVSVGSVSWYEGVD